MVNPEIGDNVEEEDIPRSDDSSSVPDNGAHDQQADVGVGNELPLGGRED